ncbi:hypothetical protein AAUPMB_15205 [Pasteurella multocida subsp. multocida str. Anand1_buffalo]|nr:hypothetical protein AAUPMB_15205 [Pasteurella multocida subsp. multocida str. Anand1_buffalo]
MEHTLLKSEIEHIPFQYWVKKANKIEKEDHMMWSFWYLKCGQISVYF